MMTNYNIIFVDRKICSEYLNLSKQEFFNKLWEWCFDEDLWDFIADNNPTKEELINFLDNIFIEENLFHTYEEDDLYCYAFKVDDKSIVSTYDWNIELENFILNKVLLYCKIVDDKYYLKNDSISNKY